jgi:hypothetical protein
MAERYVGERFQQPCLDELWRQDTSYGTILSFPVTLLSAESLESHRVRQFFFQAPQLHCNFSGRLKSLFKVGQLCLPEVVTLGT